MLLVMPGEGVDERAFDRFLSVGLTTAVFPSEEIDLLQVPFVVASEEEGIKDRPPSLR